MGGGDACVARSLPSARILGVRDACAARSSPKPTNRANRDDGRRKHPHPYGFTSTREQPLNGLSRLDLNHLDILQTQGM